MNEMEWISVTKNKSKCEKYCGKNYNPEINRR